MPMFKRILCPVDFSEASYQALAYAVELASVSMAELIVLHIGEALPSVTTGNSLGYIPEAEHRAAAVAALCALLQDKVPPHVRARPILKHGAVVEEVIHTAAALDVDLIVFAVNGAMSDEPTPAATPQTAEGQYASQLGRIATGLLSQAPCPVLAINAKR